ncbi:hypothetical protein BC628DRAFT_1321028 [Trametes gibbosa]|nr:hypothetical protein BC628DRAFT_1321028 [Trametes gibbosa]
MNGPLGSSSQASGRIFRDSVDQSLRIFVEASDLLNRPKLVSTLRNNGATISHSPAEASIILVDPQTPSGIQFIQEWGHEPGKSILDADWVQKSVERGRAFLSGDNWGGFCVSGKASETVQDPLPTPPDAPPDAQTSQTNPAMQNLPSEGSQFPQGPPHEFPFGQQLQQPQIVQQMPNGFPGGTMLPGQGIQANPNTSVVLPAQLVAQLVGLVTQQGMNPASLGMAQMIPQMPSHMGMNMMPQGYSQPPMQFLPQSSMFSQPQYSLPQQSGMYPPQYTMGPPMSQMQTSKAGSPSHYQSPTPTTPNGRSSISQAWRQSSASDTARDSPVEDVRSTSHKRKSKSADQGSASSDRHAGNARADRERSAKHRRISSPSNDALPDPDSSPSSAQPRRELPSSHGKLFADEDGQPYKFYVQVDIRPRTKIAAAIKKNGGKLVPDISDADYVILGSPSTRTFEERLQQTKNYNKLAVRPQWVFQCVEQGAIVEFDDFLFEGFTIEKKRGRPNAMGKRFVVTGPGIPPPSKGKEPPLLPDEDHDMAEEEDEVEGALVKRKGKLVSKASTLKETAKKENSKETVKKEKTVKKPAKTKPTTSAASQGASKGPPKGKAAQAKSKERSASPKRFWRPSPPPPTRVVEHMPGKNMYTKDDLDYVDEYLPILFFRDPDMTLSTVTEKLHEKMPHHTQKSWQTHITHYSRRDKLEKIRRQAHIARRKAESEDQRQLDTVSGSTPQAVQTPLPSASAPSSSAPVDKFTILMKFFAGGGADNLDDEDVWKAVNQQHPEVPPDEWEAYWAEHGDAIAVAVHQLNGAGGSSSGAPTHYADDMAPKLEPE